MRPRQIVDSVAETLIGLLRVRPYLVLPLISLALIYPLSIMKPMPLWSDPGEWLKYSKAYEALFLRMLGVNNEFVEAVERVMGGQSVFGYPPLSLLGIAVFRHVFGDVMGVHLYGILVYILLPIPMYSLVYEVTGSWKASIYSGIVTSFAPIYMEMFSWGGYPNLTALLIIPLAVKHLYRWIRGGEGIYRSVLLGILVVMTHHLSTAILITMLIGMAVIYLLIGEERAAIGSGAVGLSVLGAFMLYRYGLSYLSDYVWFNEAAYYDLRVDIVETFLYAYKTNILALLVTATVLYILYLSLDDAKLFPLLFSWIATPLILSQAYLIGVSIDFARFIFFLAQPVTLALGVGVSMIDIRHWLEIVAHWRRKLVSITLIILLAASLAATVEAGVSTVPSIDAWYQVIDPYDPWSRLDALEWIDSYTDIGSVFVADEVMGRWIEGYTLRDTLISIHPRWLFREGQVEEYYVASAILNAYLAVTTPYYRLLIQGDLGPRHSLILEAYGYGAYREVFSLPIPDIVGVEPGTGGHLPLSPVLSTERLGELGYRFYFEEGYVDLYIYGFTETGFKIWVDPELDINTSVYGIPLKMSSEYRGFRLVEGDAMIMARGSYVVASSEGVIDVYEVPWERDKLLFLSEGGLSIGFEIVGEDSGEEGITILGVDSLIELYGVDYIVAPGSSYGDPGARNYFLRNLYEPVYFNGGVVIYRARSR